MSLVAGRVMTDERLGELLALQAQLLAAGGEWAGGAEPGPEVTAARHRALSLNHERYADLVPAYRRLAEPLRALGPASLDFVVDNLLLAGLFRSYDPAWLRGGDFTAMTEWLGGVSTIAPSVDVSGVGTVGEWRGRLREAGVFLSFSSGTSGRLSFVPRDRHTWKALLTASASYADTSWRRDEAGRLQEFDCLVAGPRGDGIGILDAGNGLARTAARSHFLFDRPLTADTVRALVPEGGDNAAVKRAWLGAEEVDEAYERCFEFISTSAREGRRLLVFGAPFQVRRLCERIAGTYGLLSTASGSTLVTGGGWKAFGGERLPRARLVRLVEESLGIAAERCIDAFSTCELNCALSTCRHGRFHIPPLLEAVVLDEALTGVLGRPGHGMLAFLDPFAISYPGFLITGDRATLTDGRCGCGLRGPFIEGEIERAPDLEVRGCGGVLESLLV